ncbi:MAG: ATP-binding protein [Promethearchaeota archaeon]
MTRLTIRFPRVFFRESKDYEAIFERLVTLSGSPKIIKFSTSPHGIDVILDLDSEKVEAVRDHFGEEGVKFQVRGTVSLDKELCIDCGQCVSLCNVNALHFNEEYEVLFDPERCVGCGLCVDCCPRFAISEEH